jgi:nucleoside-diphosphate kinase
MADDPTRETTFLMLKPDAVHRGLMGKIIARFEAKGFHMVAMKFIAKPDREQVATHYKDLSHLPFYGGLVDYISSGPLVPMVWEGKGVVKEARKMMGATKPADSAPGTIRGDFCIDVGRNIIHGSDAVDTATREIGLWFPEGITSWEEVSRSYVYE